MSRINFPHYQQVQSVRDLSSQNFSKGTIHFKWGNWGAQSRWNPYKSFFKIRVKITKGDTARSALDGEFGLAPNMFLCDNLFQKISQKVNDVSVSEQNDYVAQVAALKKRMAPKAWLDSVSLTNYSEANYLDRLNRVSNDGSFLSTAYLANEVFSPLDTFALAANTGIMTFALGGVPALPDVRNIFRAGDILEFGDQAGVANKRTVTVIALLTATTIQCASGNIQTASGAQPITTGLLRVYRKPQINNGNLLGMNDVELIWRPCIGFWQVNEWLPSADYNFQVTPHPNLTYMRYAVETLRNLDPIVLNGNNAANFKVDIVNMLMYAYVGQNDDPIKSNIDLVYSESRMQSQSLTTNSLTQKTFIINPNAYALTLCYSDPSVGEDTRFSRSKFKIRDNQEQNIKRFYLRRGAQELPTPYPDTTINDLFAQKQQYIAQLYAENLMYSGNYYEKGGQETMDEWLERGLYYTYKFDGINMDERVYISQQFSTGFRQSQKSNNLAKLNPQVNLFDHYYRSCKFECKDGEIYKVYVSETN